MVSSASIYQIKKILDSDGNVLVDHFEIEPFRKHCLVNGLDDIGITLQKEEYISRYEALRREKYSFLEGGSKLLKFDNVPKRKAVTTTFDKVHQDW